jgi:hypothetical protein
MLYSKILAVAFAILPWAVDAAPYSDCDSADYSVDYSAGSVSNSHMLVVWYEAGIHD